MRRILALLPLGSLLTLAGCASEEAAGLFDTAPLDTAAGLAAPAAPKRIVEEGRAFAERDGAFVGVGPAGSLSVRLAEEGARFRGPHEELTLRFAGWGREGAVVEAPVGRPAWGPRLSGFGVESEARSVVYDRGNATEFWSSTTGGALQGWELSERPDGDGAIVLVVEVDGATPALVGGAIRLHGENGGVWSYAGLSAWDDAGRPLDAWFEVADGRVEIRVDDRGAAWPIHVDPTVTTASQTWSGSESDALGSGVAIGDFDGDGKGDVALGAPTVGEVTVYGGTASVPATAPSLTLTGPDGLYAFGATLATGDVNGDGFADLVVGAPENTTAESMDGAAWVYHGSAEGLSGTPAVKLTGSGTASAYFGNAVTTGDVNGDGYDDVIVGEYGYNSETGRVWVFAGSASGASTETLRTFTGTHSSMRFGWAVSSGGSVTGDAFDELAVGAPYYTAGSQTHAGRVLVYGGAATFFSTTPSTLNTYTGGSANFRFGTGVSIAGSYNGDDNADLAVGAPGVSASTLLGRVYYYQSSGTALPSGNTRTFDGPERESNFGAVVITVPDTDDDGYTELLVGAPDYADDSGWAALYDGGSSGLSSGNRSSTFSGTPASDLYAGDGVGTALAAGDVNGDGNADLLLGLPDSNWGGGMALLHLGGADEDGDGYLVNGSGLNEDCDDTDEDVHPGATEVCDADDVDEDCDGAADDADDGATGKLEWFTDADDDGYGTGEGVSACDGAEGYASVGGDCDDADAAVNPAAAEVCGGGDEDCDDLVDDADDSVSEESKTTFYSDRDGDGYGNALETGAFCVALEGFVADATDCDDRASSVNPGAAEVCDPEHAVDEDCDESVDEAGAEGEITWFRDADGDGYGDPDVTERGCAQPEGFVADGTDCDDALAAVNPGATEVCDAENVDEDCDGAADDADADGAEGKGDYYVDADGDSFGSDVSAAFCDMPDGYVADSTDCDDTTDAVSPAATEVCDADNVDEDCDGAADDADDSATGKTTWYADGDGDTFGGDISAEACDAPEGHVADSTDCDDTSAAVSPAATEVCDDANVDEDCSGAADDADAGVDASTRTAWYTDADLDGYGATDTMTLACDAADGRIAVDGDCDDAAPGVNPAAIEACDAENVDEDCDGLADDADDVVDDTTVAVFYADTDGDGFGNPAVSVAQCDAPEAYVAEASDCDDTLGEINPAAGEVCDGVDNDCDLLVDDEDDSVDATGTVWYADVDGDGFGDAASPVFACVMPEGASSTADDCDDALAEVSPDAAEVCGDGVDNDCDGVGLDVDDEDGDALTSAEEATLGTDPCLADTDEDGLDDGEESLGGTDPLAADTDEDGLDDGDEIAAGTDPNDPDTDGDDHLDGADEDPLVPATDDTGDTDDTGTDDDTGADGGDDKGGEGCGGCSSTTPASAALPGLLLAGAALARRRRE